MSLCARSQFMGTSPLTAVFPELVGRISGCRVDWLASGIEPSLLTFPLASQHAFAMRPASHARWRNLVDLAGRIARTTFRVPRAPPRKLRLIRPGSKGIREPLMLNRECPKVKSRVDFLQRPLRRSATRNGEHTRLLCSSSSLSEDKGSMPLPPRRRRGWPRALPRGRRRFDQEQACAAQQPQTQQLERLRTGAVSPSTLLHDADN